MEDLSHLASCGASSSLITSALHLPHQKTLYNFCVCNCRSYGGCLTPVLLSQQTSHHLALPLIDFDILVFSVFCFSGSTMRFWDGPERETGLFVASTCTSSVETSCIWIICSKNSLVEQCINLRPKGSLQNNLHCSQLSGRKKMLFVKFIHHFVLFIKKPKIYLYFEYKSNFMPCTYCHNCFRGEKVGYKTLLNWFFITVVFKCMGGTVKNLIMM